MKTPSTPLVEALRRTADRLERPETRYSWSHQGNCNCGHLAQTLTRLAPEQIHAWAIEKQGDWADKAVERCGVSEHPIDAVLSAMSGAGMTPTDIVHLERLSHPDVLALLPAGQRWLQRNRREDVVWYMRAWADLLQTRELARFERLLV